MACNTVSKITSGGTHLNGTIPTELGLLTNLKVLDLSTNDFSGTVPSFLAALANLGMLCFALVLVLNPFNS
jgi:Leucine-rich repeat (LRR) protein